MDPQSSGERGWQGPRGKALAIFIGTFENKVDKKGRVSVPAPFRAVLAGQGFQGIVAFPSHRADAVEGCGMDFMEELTQRVSEFDLFSEDHDNLAFTIFSDSHTVPFDGEGRVVLPKELLEAAGITDRAAFVGKGRTFQIWEPNALYRIKAAARERAREQRLTLPANTKDGGSGGGAA